MLTESYWPADQSGRVLDSTVGEPCARGYLVMSGYHDMPEATAQAIDDDGRCHTGDLASMDGRGFLRIEGRVKDMIIRGGEYIYPREIEDALFASPSVADVAVVGMPDDRWGEVVAAFVRPPTVRSSTEACSERTVGSGSHRTRRLSTGSSCRSTC